jgi:8-hydroxy-5-deazaflavin:NADPH oxidoreductase
MSVAVPKRIPATIDMEINMTYAIIGTGTVGTTLARFFAAKNIPVLIANSRGPKTLAEVAAEIGPTVTPATVAEAVKADIIFVAVGAVAFKDVGAVLKDWSGKIVIDVTNGFMLPPEVQQAEYQGRLTSEVNAKRVPGAKLVKAFNQLPLKVLASPLPDNTGRRVVFVSSDHEDASATVAALAESLGFAAIEVGKIAEGGRLIQARAPLVFQNLIKYPM